MLSVYRASAGSGKTFTLAKDYIKLLISVKRKDSTDDRLSTYELNLDRNAASKPRMIMPHRHRAILAITFTHKATEEMKTRILSELRTLSDPAKKSDYEKEFMDDLRCSRRELAIVADLALRQILYDYHNFNVSTIDSFFQRVLHTFARELDHQSDYSVELSEKAAMAQAVGTMLDDFNSSHYRHRTQLEAWLYEFLSDQIDRGGKANFFNRNSKVHGDLIDLMSKIGQESFKEFSDDMRAYLEDPKRVNDFTSALRRKILGIPAIVKSEIETLVTADEADHLNKRGSYNELVKTALQGRKLSSKQIDSLESTTVQNIANGSSVFTGKWGTPAQQQAMARAMDIIRTRYHQHEALRKLLDCMPMLGLLAHAWRYLQELTRENNILLISDTNDLVSRIIGHDDTPFIYERMGVRLNHFLIDEFQDTSRLQWANLEPLVANGLSGGDDSLVIGDEKQSIYRFRNSDSSILHSQIEESLGRYVDPDAEARRKNVNWRSSERVVRFNNTLFSIFNEQMAVDGYDGVAQRVSPRHRLKTLNPGGERGYVRFIETLRGRGCEKTKDCLKAKSDAMLHMMAAEILRQHHQGGYAWKDIAVLVDSNAEAQLVVSFLIDNYFDKIKVLSDEALKLASSPAVQLVISTMKIIDAEGSTPAREEGERMSQSQIALALSRFEYFLSRDPADGDAARYSRALRQALSPSEQDAGTAILDGAQTPSSILALAEMIVARHFSADERKRHFAYLAALCDVIVEFSSLHSGSLHEFLDWWDANSASLAITGATEADAVKVMTVHKSKGLEFECVLIPFCNWELYWSGIHPPQVWTATPDLSDLGLDDQTPPPALFITIDDSDSRPDAMFHQAYADERAKSLSDNINKTYVAFTRAKSELIVWYSDNSSIIGKAINAALAAGTPAGFDPETMLDLAPYRVDADKITGTPPPISDFVLGEPTVKPKGRGKDKNGAITIEASYPVNTGDKARAALSVSSVLGADDSSIVEEEEPDKAEAEAIADAPDQASRQLGIMLHEVMALTRRSADLAAAARRVARMCRLSSDEARDIEAIARRALEIDPAMTRRWFDDFAKVHIEQPLYVPSLDIVRRPDRVIYCPDGSVDVIDYKFTDRPYRLGADYHLAQLREYMGLISDTGCHPVRGYLVYPRLGKILPVSP